MRPLDITTCSILFVRIFYMSSQKKEPFFTIITCTYNSERFIRNNLSSVKRQVYKNFEQVFVDGNSTDKTIIYLRKYKNTSDFPVRIIQAEPKGISYSFNVGIENSKGKYLYFLNSDDELYDRLVLKDVSDNLEDAHNLDWLYAKIMVKDEKGLILGTFPNYKILQLASPLILKFVNFIPHQATFVKKDVFEKYGKFDENLKSSMDTDLWLRIANRTNWVFYDRIIANYLVRKGAQTSDLTYRSENIEYFYKVKKRHLKSIEYQIFKFIYERVLMKRVKILLRE